MTSQFPIISTTIYYSPMCSDHRICFRTPIIVSFSLKENNFSDSSVHMWRRSMHQLKPLIVLTLVLIGDISIIPTDQAHGPALHKLTLLAWGDQDQDNLWSGAEPGFRYRGAGRTLNVDKNYIVPTGDFDVGLKNYRIWCWIKNLQ
jgi:hypothetical protein